MSAFLPVHRNVFFSVTHGSLCLNLSEKVVFAGRPQFVAVFVGSARYCPYHLSARLMEVFVCSEGANSSDISVCRHWGSSQESNSRPSSLSLSSEERALLALLWGNLLSLIEKSFKDVSNFPISRHSTIISNTVD